MVGSISFVRQEGDHVKKGDEVINSEPFFLIERYVILSYAILN
jgi:hypothetical protein